jgi:hypothetical protein
LYFTGIHSIRDAAHTAPEKGKEYSVPPRNRTIVDASKQSPKSSHCWTFDVMFVNREDIVDLGSV